MQKTEARTCFGCKANCSKGCAFGFGVRKLKVREGTDRRVFKFPAEPCYRATTNKQFHIVAEHLEATA